MSKVKEEPASMVQTAVQAAALVRGTLAAIAARQLLLTEERATLQARVRTVRAMPVGPEDALQLMFKLIDRKAALFEQQAGWREAVEGFLMPKGDRPPVHDEAGSLLPGAAAAHSGPLNMADLTSRQGVSLTPGFLGEGTGAAGVKTIELAMYALLGDEIKQRLGRSFRHLCGDWFDRHGRAADEMTIEDREAEIDRHEQRLAELDTELLELARQANELSVAVK